MPAKAHAIWDVRRSWPLRPKEPGRQTSAERAERRAGLFETAAGGESSGVDPTSLRDEARRRVSRLIAGTPDNLWNRSGADVAVLLPMFLIILWIPMTVIFLAEWRRTAASSGKFGWMTAANLTFIAVQAGLLIHSLRRNRRVLRRAAAGLCPDCGYDLAACPRERGLDAATLGVDIGPARCPECGSFWPLVPPPGREGPAGMLGPA